MTKSPTDIAAELERLASDLPPGEWRTPDVLRDGGEIARRALAGSAAPTQTETK